MEKAMSGTADSILKRFFVSRSFRLGASVLLLTASVLLSAEFFDIRLTSHQQIAENRISQAETLAVQLSSLVGQKKSTGIDYTIASFVDRNDNVLAASLLTSDNTVLAGYGDQNRVKNLPADKTTDTLTVPIYRSDRLWGEVKVIYEKPQVLRKNLLYFFYVLSGCFISYLCFLNRALVLLDPGRVVPNRVNTAFNMFSEGVIILDDSCRILLANESIADCLNVHADALMGHSIDEWNWQQSDNKDTPWQSTLKSGVSIEDLPMRLIDPSGADKLFVVSTSVIGNVSEEMQGVFVTLDNMTAIEQKNNELAVTLHKLRRTQEAIEQKNKELQTLATSDPMTGLSNRRAVLEVFEKCFVDAKENDRPLSCVILDIDNFKSINDGHGHAVGDEIICAVAKVLIDTIEKIGFAGRYGGEEFLLILPDCDANAATEISEQIRISVSQLGDKPIVPIDMVTASFGVSELESHIASIEQLIEQADQALYYAKQHGRNRVVEFDKNLNVFEDKDSLQANSERQDTNSLTRIAQLEAVVRQRNAELMNIREFNTNTGSPKEKILKNRLDEALNRADRFGSLVAVFAFEIKNFDRITRGLGSTDSTLLIKQFIDRIKNGLRKSDFVCIHYPFP